MKEPDITKATPRPWSTDGRFIYPCEDWQRAKPGTPFVADCCISETIRANGSTQANTALIVKAVNEYEALCAVAKAAETLLGYVELYKNTSVTITGQGELRESLTNLAAIRKEISS